jgi:hypothetical protein
LAVLPFLCHDSLSMHDEPESAADAGASRARRARSFMVVGWWQHKMHVNRDA